MKCCVPGCTSLLGRKTAKIRFCAIPLDKSFADIKQIKRKDWLRAIKSRKALKTARVCSKHFDTGQTTLNNANFNLDDSIIKSIITNTPEVTEEFDVPEYVMLDDESKIELDVIHKYITNPVCDENGFYINDHDYLGLPIIRKKTESHHRDMRNDHDYSINDSPACFYADLRHFCNICQRNYFNLFTFNAHIMLHTIQNDVVCPICGLKLLTTTCLNNHISTHKTICDICGTEVPTVQIKAHQEANKQQKMAFDAQNRYKITDDEKVNFCIFCMKKFENDYVQHLTTHAPRKRRGRLKKKVQ